MTALQQEACNLIQEQSEHDLVIFIEILKALKARQKKDNEPFSAERLVRFGAGKGEFKLPEGFFEHFDDTNDEIAKMFYGEDE